MILLFNSMLQSHKISFYIILGLIFLIPLFFIPGSLLSLSMAKTALLVVATVLGALVFLFELWREGRVALPRTPLVWVLIALPVVYFLSAILATPSSLSLFGYGFEAGTFGFILLGSAIMLLASIVFVDTTRALKGLMAFFLSITILALFMAAKILIGGDALALGNFFGVMGNPLGSWTDLAVVFGLLSILSILALGMLPMKGMIKGLVYVVFVLATLLMVVINFQTAFIFTLVASVVLFFYFTKVEKRHSADGVERGRGFLSSSVMLPVILGIISLIFVINPNISTDTNLGSMVSGKFGINNAEVRPSFGATLGVSKAVLAQAGLLGSGPNTFGRDWLIFKPTNINSTPFWAASFPFGAGFLPTQIATTGILGTAVWILFFVFLIALVFKSVSRTPESRGERLVLISTMMATLFLWATSFMYAPSFSTLLLAFIFTGLFVATAMRAGVVTVNEFNFKHTQEARVAAMIALLILAVGSLAVGKIGVEKTVSAYYFNQAITLSNTEGTPLSDIEAKLIKAVETAPADVYFVALSRLNFTRAQMAANSATGTPEENRAIFEESVGRSIEAARLAVDTNPAGFENWVALGNIYTALVPEPVALEGAYENAIFAYTEAARRNPNNPELPLLIAQLELNNKKVDEARSYILRSIALKQDYADAYLMLAQLEVAAGNTAAAIQSAEALAVLLPQNPGIHFELGLLKFSSKNYEGAKVSFEKSLELSPEFANAKYYLALTFANLGSFAEAQAELEDLLTANPGNPELEKALTSVKANKVPPPPAPAVTTPEGQ